jgi:hypothetical protein
MHPHNNPARHFAGNTSVASVTSTPRIMSSTRIGRISVALAVLLALVVTTSPWAQSPASAAVASDSTIFGTSAPQGLATHTDASGVEVGTKFTASSNGTATAMRFWKGQGSKQPHTGTLWSSTGTKLAGATFNAETATGWQTANFDRQVALKAGQAYVVSYYVPNGRYAVTQNYTGKAASPDLAIAAGAGVFKYGSGPAFPTSGYRNSVYWVDVVFAKSAATPTPAPAPAPAPAPTPAPAPAPTPGAFPNADTTGPPAGTALKASGGITITTAGAVYDGYKFSGDVTIKANNVTIRNSVVNGRIESRPPYTGLLVQRTEIVGPGPGYSVKYPGIGYSDFTCDSCDIHGWGDGAMLDANVTIKNSWIHDLAVSGDSHNQGILSLGGPNFTIVNNRVDAEADGHFTAALSFLNQWGKFTNTLVQGNLFNGGGYCVYGGGEPKGNAARPSSNVRFLDNTFGTSKYPKCGYYGPVTAFDSSGAGNQWTNNRWVGGGTVPPAL